MELKKEMEDFLFYPDNCGALLITGNWGTGKSYAIKQCIDELNFSKKYAIAIVSLFGVDSIDVLHDEIKKKYIDICAAFLDNSLNSSASTVQKALSFIKKLAQTATSDSAAASAVSVGVNTLLPFNPLEFIYVKNKAGIKDEVPSFALVFDDFERCGIPIIDLMGVINEYSENRRIKTVIIADQGKISDKKYYDFKEKLITRTVVFNPDLTGAIDSILESYPETDMKYKQFLLEHKPQLKKAFEDSGYNNLRTLKSCIFDFKRIYDVWPPEVMSKTLSDILYIFCAMEYEAKAGQFSKDKYGVYRLYNPDDPDGKKYGQHIAIESKYLSNTFRETIYSIAQWVVDGKWNVEDFLSEIKRIYLVENIPPAEKFVRMSIWDLEQADIELGMPVVVEKAYQGKATFGEVISLLRKTHTLKQYEIPLPCEVDYGRIFDGVKLRKTKFRNGELEIDHTFRNFAPADVDSEAHAICEEVFSMEYLEYAWENRHQFIQYLKNNKNVSIYDFKGGYIDYFDDELLQLFVEKYFGAKNLEKRELCTALLEVKFDNDQCSKDLDKELTKINLEKLVAELEEHIANSEDRVSILIDRDFKAEIEKKIKSTVSNE